jgi:hypothetical protein
MNDILLDTSLVTTRDSHNSPIIVVGMPRSGSSFLSHIMSQIEGWYVFDDLYLEDKAKEIGATSDITEDQLEKLLYFLGWQIRARLRFGNYAIPNVSEDEIEPLNDRLRSVFKGKNFNWKDLQKEWMVRLALRNNCQNWGYKMPKAFLSKTELDQSYVSAKYIYILRRPYDVLRSFKFIKEDNQDGHPGRYHPIFYALYWRLAAKTFKKQHKISPDRVMLLTFNELTQDTKNSALRIAKFLDTKSPETIDVPKRPNTSFSKATENSELTWVEIFIVNLLCKKEMQYLVF